MAEQPLEMEKPGADVPSRLIPPAETNERANDDGLLPPTQQQPVIENRDGPIVVRELYQVDADRRLPEFDQPSAKAFFVENRHDISQKLFALACTPGLPVRIDIIKKMVGHYYPGLLTLIEWDVVYWPPLGQSTLVVIYESPLGGRVLTRLSTQETKITEYDVPKKVAEPLLEAIHTIEEEVGPHRAIRADNLYFLDEDLEEIVLGPCVTSPPGFDQPSLYEPVYRAICQPEGRGTGDSRDDIFALAVSIIHLVIGRNPVAKIKEEKVLHNRLENGSYEGICNNIRLPLALIGPLRSMMADDPSIRWTYEDADSWAKGEMVETVKRLPPIKADIPFRFRKREHLTFETLCWHFCQHVEDAARVIQGDEFANWIKRHPSNLGLLQTIRGIIQARNFFEDSHQGSDAFMLTKVAILMDPNSPIQYKGLTFMPDGYGTLLGTIWNKEGGPQESADILNHDIASLWFSGHERVGQKLLDARKNFDQFRSLLSIKDPGYGLERIAYASCPGLPCLSPLIVRHNVLVIEQLLPALEGSAVSADTSSNPIDRHVAGFIAARFDSDTHPHLKAFASPKEDTSTIGMLSLLALLQWKLRSPPMLALSSWVGGLLGPAISAYHNRQTQEHLEREIPKLVRKGSMPELFNLIDDSEKRREDHEGFIAAQTEWLAAEEEIRSIEGADEERVAQGELSGQQAAATISILLSLAVISILFVTGLG